MSHFKNRDDLLLFYSDTDSLAIVFKNINDFKYLDVELNYILKIYIKYLKLMFILVSLVFLLKHYKI